MTDRTIEFSIRFPPTQPSAPLAEAARQAEDAGFSTIWMVDTPLIAGAMYDPYVDLTVCALATSRVRLGPAVSTFELRHPVATAGAILSLDRASNGRAILGLGIGGSALVTLGQIAGHEGAFTTHSTKERRGRLREGTRFLRQIFAGESVSLGTRAIQLTESRPVPVYIAASGPRALEMAGGVADGVIIQVGIEPEAMREAIAAVRRGAERAGRDPSSVRLVASTFAVVSHDRAEDIDRVRPLASYFYSVVPQVLERVGISTAKRFPEWVPKPDLTHAFDWHDAMAAAATYIPDETVERFCLVGPPDDARQRISELAALGVDEVFLRWQSSYDLPTPLIETFGREIIPHVQPSSADDPQQKKGH
jgi:5,10-methylenetetrahydromethanopterin reductase